MVFHYYELGNGYPKILFLIWYPFILSPYIDELKFENQKSKYEKLGRLYMTFCIYLSTLKTLI